MQVYYFRSLSQVHFSLKSYNCIMCDLQGCNKKRQIHLNQAVCIYTFFIQFISKFHHVIFLNFIHNKKYLNNAHHL